MLILKNFGTFPDEVLILGLIYLNKMLMKYKLVQTSYLVGMYSTCVFLAHKFLVEYEFWPIEEYSKLVLIQEKYIRKWEVQVLHSLDFRMSVPLSEFEAFKRDVFDE